MNPLPSLSILLATPIDNITKLFGLQPGPSGERSHRQSSRQFDPKTRFPVTGHRPRHTCTANNGKVRSSKEWDTNTFHRDRSIETTMCAKGGSASIRKGVYEDSNLLVQELRRQSRQVQTLDYFGTGLFQILY